MNPENKDLLLQAYNEGLKLIVPALLSWAVVEFRSIKKQIQELSMDSAIFREKMQQHEKKLDNHESRLTVRQNRGPSGN